MRSPEGRGWVSLGGWVVLVGCREAWVKCVGRWVGRWGGQALGKMDEYVGLAIHTDFGRAVHLQDFGAFGDSCSGVVDDIQHAL